MVFSNVLAIHSDNIHDKVYTEQIDGAQSISASTSITYSTASHLLNKPKSVELFSFISVSKEYSLKELVSIKYQLQKTLSQSVFNFHQIHLIKLYTIDLGVDFLS